MVPRNRSPYGLSSSQRDTIISLCAGGDRGAEMAVGHDAARHRVQDRDVDTALVEQVPADDLAGPTRGTGGRDPRCRARTRRRARRTSPSRSRGTRGCGTARCMKFLRRSLFDLTKMCTLASMTGVVVPSRCCDHRSASDVIRPRGAPGIGARRTASVKPCSSMARIGFSSESLTSAQVRVCAGQSHGSADRETW